jgi:hypothetical protein
MYFQSSENTPNNRLEVMTKVMVFFALPGEYKADLAEHADRFHCPVLLLKDFQ